MEIKNLDKQYNEKKMTLKKMQEITALMCEEAFKRMSSNPFLELTNKRWCSKKDIDKS